MEPRVLRSRRARPAWALLVAAAALSGPAAATGYLAYERAESCLECHVRWGGGGGLNEKGEEARARGFRFARDPALVIDREWAPLTPGGAQMLEERYRDLGRRLFGLARVGRVGRSCQDCHAAEELREVYPEHPKPREDLGRWVSLEGAINHCLAENMRTAPLVDASRTMVALVSYLKSLAPRVHPTRGVVSEGSGGGAEE